MNLTQIITAVMVIFLVIGAVDYAMGNRFGLGHEFEEGIMACGRLTLCMAGFMVLAPLIAQQLGPVVSPLFRSLGIDTSRDKPAGEKTVLLIGLLSHLSAYIGQAQGKVLVHGEEATVL